MVDCNRVTLRAVFALGLLLPWVSGCVIVQPMVANPLPNVTRVAIVPFVNQSSEPAVDVLQVTNAYYGELQKVPGFEVVPIGVTIRKIESLGLRLTGPESALHLARVLDVDAVVIGSITDYDPYDPPRIGWHVEWYSPHPPEFGHGMPVDPYLRPDVWNRRGSGDGSIDAECEDREPGCDEGGWENGPRDTAGRSRGRTIVRGQSPSTSIFEIVPPAERPRVYGPRLIRPSDVRTVDAEAPRASEPTNQGTAGEPPVVEGRVIVEPELDGPAVGESPFYSRDVHWWNDERTKPPVDDLVGPEETTTGSPRVGLFDMVPPSEGEPGPAPVPAPVPIDDEDQMTPSAPSADSRDSGDLDSPRVPFRGAPPAMNDRRPEPVAPQQDVPRLPDRTEPPPIDRDPVPEHSEPTTTRAMPSEPARLPLMHGPLPHGHSPGPVVVVPEPVEPEFDPREPIMAYTRLFDGRNVDLHARLRDYYELNGDVRAGGWRAYLQRSEDFVRFTAHVSIAEMLTLHGGETKRRYVWKLRRRS